MLPNRDCVNAMASGMVVSRPDTGWETTADGSSAEGCIDGRAACADRATVSRGARRGDAHAVSDDSARGRRQARATDRLDDAAQRGHGTPCPRSIPARRCRCGPTALTSWPSGRSHRPMAVRTATRHRPGPAQCRCAECGLDHAPAERLFGTGDGTCHGHRDRADLPASAGLRVQTANLESETQSQPTSRVGKKRLRVEVLLAAAASPVPPPLDDLVPDPLLRDELPEDLTWLLRLLPRADVYLQDEVELALLPTLTRVWCLKGRRGQRLVETPGNNEKQYGFGLVDWREGWFDWERAPGRRAAPFCAQLRRAVERSQSRGRIALVLLDNLGIHTPKGSLLLRKLLEELHGQLVLVYTPAYDPDANRIEWLWRALRRAVTHAHTRETLPALLEDADSWAYTISSIDVLRQIGSPFADSPTLYTDEELTHAA